MTTYHFVVPGDPIPKARARVAGHAYTPKRTKDAEARIQFFARKARVQRIEGPVFLYVICYRATKRNADWDNLGKTVSDALNGIAWTDDGQVCDAYVSKRHDPKDPRTEISIIAMTSQEFTDAF